MDPIDSRLRIEIRYATADDFLGRRLYAEGGAWLRPATAGKLVSAVTRLERWGVGLKVLDAYRPPSAQRAMWAAMPDERFVARPERGSRHTRGTAVDVTLTDGAGVELSMPSAFDEFGPRAHREWAGATEEMRRHLDWLTAAMTEAGFTTISTEWWHFDDADWRRHPLLSWEFGVETECGPGRDASEREAG